MTHSGFKRFAFAVHSRSNHSMCKLNQGSDVIWIFSSNVSPSRASEKQKIGEWFGDSLPFERRISVSYTLALKGASIVKSMGPKTLFDYYFLGGGGLRGEGFENLWFLLPSLVNLHFPHLLGLKEFVTGQSTIKKPIPSTLGQTMWVALLSVQVLFGGSGLVANDM